VNQFVLHGVRKRYEDRVALDLENLELQQHQLHIIIGPNGSGKSTLLNILAFLMEPDAGEVLFAGERVDWGRERLQCLRARATLMQQSPFLFSGNVQYNLEFGLRLRGLGRADRRSRVQQALARVGLPGFEQRNVRHLSGGERRRIALARSLVLGTEVLLLDEPMANVDRESTRELERLIYELPAAGTTVVMATHHLHHSDQFRGNIIALEEGRLDEANCRFHCTR
jgi:tungstate transport system ATP-binding protein